MTDNRIPSTPHPCQRARLPIVPTSASFTFDRDEHFVHIDWPTGSHVMSAETFLGP